MIFYRWWCLLLHGLGWSSYCKTSPDGGPSAGPILDLGGIKPGKATWKLTGFFMILWNWLKHLEAFQMIFFEHLGWIPSQGTTCALQKFLNSRSWVFRAAGRNMLLQKKIVWQESRGYCTRHFHHWPRAERPGGTANSQMIPRFGASKTSPFV